MKDKIDGLLLFIFTILLIALLCSWEIGQANKARAFEEYTKICEVGK